MAASSVFDVDKYAGSFEPLQVKFRGEVYAFGRSADAMLAATDAYAQVGEKAGMRGQLAALPTIVRALCPEFPPVDDLNPGEEFALLSACTEVMRRAGDMRFPSSGARRGRKP